MPTWADHAGADADAGVDADAAARETARRRVLDSHEAARVQALAARERDERDADYDRGRVKKTKRDKGTRFDPARNPFQELASKRRRPDHDAE